MKKEYFRITVGASVVIVHTICFFIIFMTKSDYLTRPQMIDIALLLSPITAAYLSAVVRSAIENQNNIVFVEKINLNYALIVGLFTIISLGALIWTVVGINDASDDSKRLISAFEIVFGATFGLLVRDLFGEIKYVEIKGEDKADV